MKKLQFSSLLFGIILFLGHSATTTAQNQIPVFGPEHYTRDTGAPATVTRTFSVQSAMGPFTLQVQNAEGKRGRVSSGVIRLNGVQVVGPNEFNKNVDLISKPVNLLQENTISVELRGSPRSSLDITILGIPNPVSPINGITINPDAIFVNEPNNITIRASYPYGNNTAPPVILQRVDTSGNVLAVEGSMTDDGNLNNSDEIAGDGVFSIKKLFSSASEQRIRLRISVQQDGQTFNSNVFFLDAFAHLTDSQLNAILTLQNTSEQNFYSLIPSLGRSEARNAVLSQIQQSPIVLQAGISGSGNGIWILYTAGTVGGLNLNPSGTRGGFPLLSDSPAEALFSTADNVGPLEQSGQAMLLPTPTENAIKNRKAIVLSPFLFQFGNTDEGPAVAQMLTSSTCPKYEVTHLTNSAVTVGTMKMLGQYGTVSITTHGDSFYNGILSLWQDVFGWNFFGGQVVFLTGEVATTSNKAAYEIDLKKGRLAITNNGSGYYSILPSFINYYGGKFPDSLVYVGSCRSTFNNSMANAFLSKGAKTFLGFSEYVDSGFAGQASTTFFQAFLGTPGGNVGDAFTPGQSDTNSPPAFFELRGSDDLETPSSGLENEGFEFGSLGAWKPTGDGRVVTQLGQFQPIEGSFMGIVSTGLGFTTASGTIEQEICLPADAQQLQFNWNFNSEEFIEYCGSIFQDTFSVTAVTSNSSQVLFSRKVDDLCSAVSPSNLHFDVSGGACSPTSGNDCLVWTTGWQSAAINISSIATASQGSSIKLRFSASDVGDSAFDTAILVDNIKITTP